MSRSYKKYPVVRQEKIDKCEANKKVRRSIKIVLKGSQYKKVSLGSNRHYIWTRQDAIKKYHESANLQKRYKTLNDYLNYWQRCCVRK